MTKSKKSTRILIVEENKSICTALSFILRSEGYEVVGELTTADNLENMINRVTPDIICLEREMPGNDGMKLFNQLKESMPKIAVLMITDTKTLEIQQEALAAGVSGFLLNPFRQAQVLTELNQVDHARKLLQISIQSPGSNSADINVVVADDSAIMRDLLSAIIKSMGISVIGEARDGAEAVEMTTKHTPHAVCLDLDMPNMDGLEAMEKIKSTHPEIKVIVVSGIAEREKVQRAIDLGAIGYIIKPYEIEQVIQTLNKLLIDQSTAS